GGAESGAGRGGDGAARAGAGAAAGAQAQAPGRGGAEGRGGEGRGGPRGGGGAGGGPPQGRQVAEIKWTAEDFAAAEEGQLPLGKPATEWVFGDVEAKLKGAHL